MEQNEARLNITFAGQNGDFPDPVPFDASDAEILRWSTEGVRSGGVPGVDLNATAEFTDFIVDRFSASEDHPFNRLMVRPKTPFGQ